MTDTLDSALKWAEMIKQIFLSMSTETMKTSEGENMEHSDGSIKVWFGNQVEVKLGFSVAFSVENDSLATSHHLFPSLSFQAHSHHL